MNKILHEARSAWLEQDTLDAQTGSAISLFVKLAARWGLSGADCQTLLGGISRPTWQNWKRGKHGGLSRDQIERLSLIFGIHKGLRTVFADDEAALRWLKAANHDYPFGGASPLASLLRGGMNDLYAARRYLDSWRGVR